MSHSAGNMTVRDLTAALKEMYPTMVFSENKKKLTRPQLVDIFEGRAQPTYRVRPGGKASPRGTAPSEADQLNVKQLQDALRERYPGIVLSDENRKPFRRLELVRLFEHPGLREGVDFRKAAVARGRTPGRAVSGRAPSRGASPARGSVSPAAKNVDAMTVPELRKAAQAKGSVLSVGGKQLNREQLLAIVKGQAAPIARKTTVGRAPSRGASRAASRPASPARASARAGSVRGTSPR